jgi:hypothetical protein
MATIICPVANCGKEIHINSSNQGYKHFQNDNEFHKQLHYNWLNYFFPDLAGSDYPDAIKFRRAYQRWNEQQKEYNKQHGKGGNNISGNFEVRNGKIFRNDL